MIGEQKTKDEGYVSVATKVPSHVAELLTILARMRGMEVYELLQLLVNGFISYAKAETSVPEEFRHLYESLKFDVAWNQAFNFASPTAASEIAQMILVLQQPGRTGFGMMMIDKPFMTNATMTTCVPTIVERIMQLSLGLRDYMALRDMVTDHNMKDQLDMIQHMIAAQMVIDLDESDREELPAMGQYHDFGKIIEYGKRTKQYKHRTPDSLANSQQKILFDDFDRETAEHEAEEWEGEQHQSDHENPLGDVQPFGVEP